MGHPSRAKQASSPQNFPETTENPKHTQLLTNRTRGKYPKNPSITQKPSSKNLKTFIEKHPNSQPNTTKIHTLIYIPE